MRISAGVTLAAAAVVVACSAPASAIKPIGEVDINAWRAQIIAWPSAPNDPDMEGEYRSTVVYCGDSVDDLASKMADPVVDPTLVLVGVNYVCPGREAKVADAMREMTDHQGRQVPGWVR